MGGGLSNAERVAAAAVWDFLAQSGLDAAALQQVCQLAMAAPTDGCTLPEFELAMHLVQGAAKGLPLPHLLPPHLQITSADERIRALELELARVCRQQVRNGCR
jgi:hypothetical protein